MQPITVQSTHALRAMAVTASMLAAYAAFTLAERGQAARQGWRQQGWLALAAVVFGLGLWSTYFFGAMEASGAGTALYSLPLVGLALLASVVLSWVGFRLVLWDTPPTGRVATGGFVLGFAIVGMYGLGMHALRSGRITGWHPGWAVLALGATLLLSVFAVGLGFYEGKDSDRSEWLRVVGGAVLGAVMIGGRGFAQRALTVEPREVSGAVSSLVRGSSIGEIALLITVGLVLLVTLGTAAMDKHRYRELVQLHRQLRLSKEALVRSEASLRQANELLSELSIRDGLTGLYNRRRFDEVFEMEWRRSLRTMRPLALLMIDVDCFKALNDTYGHQRGDDCLREIARVLEEQPRRGHDTVARFGGEEFAVLLPGADSHGALRVAESIRSAVEAQRMEHKRSQVGAWVTVSVGVCSCTPKTGEEAKTMIYSADMAMYTAKQLGRNRVALREDAGVEV